MQYQDGGNHLSDVREYMEKAWKAVEASDLPKFYFDLKAAKAALQKNQTPWTPGISIIVAMNKALDLLFEEGLENVFIRHRILAMATQKAAIALGLEFLVTEPVPVQYLRQPGFSPPSTMRSGVRNT